MLKQKGSLPPVVFLNDGFDWALRGNRYYYPYYWSFKTKVLVVAPHLSFHSSFKRFFTKKPELLEKFKENLYIFRPSGHLPFNRSLNLPQEITYRINRVILENLFRKLNIENPILWTFYPKLFLETKEIKHRFSVYHVVDEYWQYPSYYPTRKDKSEARKLGKQVASEADMVLTTSTYLFQENKRFNKNTFMVSNGAETEFIIEKTSELKEKPEELKGISKPIIGFVGYMADFRFDLALTSYLIKKFNSVNFVLIGPAENNQKKLRKLAQENHNCFYLGFKPFGRIPEFLKFFDVCLIPYLKNKYTQGILPLKLFEYFAVGKPVVATDLYSISAFSKMVYTADSKESFALKIKEALCENNKKLKRERMKIARQHSWNKLVAESQLLIVEALEKNESEY